METEYFSFNPGTNTCRAPEVTNFDHLLAFAAKIEQYVTIHNQEELININQMLESTVNLQISNIIQRVIAQIIGQTPTGFVTIQGTEDGALHVSIKEDPTSKQTPLSAAINFATAATQDVIAAVAGKSHKITAIVLTVAGETNITLRDETGLLSGAMDFGGVGQPWGMVSNHAIIPLVCTVGEKFQIVNSAAIQVSGYVLYYDE